MDRTKTFTCPHGKTVRYETFRWVHPNGARCETMGSVHYTKVAASFHRVKVAKGVRPTPAQQAWDSLTKPDLPWLVTPQGVEGLCMWLSEGGEDISAANKQFCRMAALAASPVLMVVGRALRSRIPMFSKNLRYVVRSIQGAFLMHLPYAYGMCGVITAGAIRTYKMVDLHKHHINPTVDEPITTVREATRRAKNYVEVQTDTVAQELQRIIEGATNIP